MKKFVRTVVGGALLSSVALTACSQDPEPRIADSSQPSESSGAPSDTATTSVDETEPPARESPKKFVKRVFQAERRLIRTGDDDYYLSFTRNCATCERVAELTSSIYAVNRRIVGPLPVAREFEEVERNGRAVTFEYVVRSPPQNIVEADGAVVSEFGLVTYWARITVVPRGDSWAVTKLDNIGSMDGEPPEN